ncbi:MAG: DsbA family protein [Anaerolineales bacterium]|nr:DsbA family protein [Anaerolineales bacterium]
MIEVEKREFAESDLPLPTSADTGVNAVPETKSTVSPNPWLLLVIGLLVGGLAGFYLYPLVIPETVINQGPLAAVKESDQINKPDPHQAVMLAVIAGARHFQGDENAPITLIEFGDFNCGYCAKWTQETLPLIDEKYIKTGKVRMAYVHYPILGDDSMTAAEGAECAAQQDKFWDYHNTLYANRGVGFTPANLTQLATDLGLDKATFEQCLANFSDRTSLEEDIRLAQVMGVRGTPAFLVNGVPLAGAYPYEDFERVIEGVLAGQF